MSSSNLSAHLSRREKLQGLFEGISILGRDWCSKWRKESQQDSDPEKETRAIEDPAQLDYHSLVR